MSPCALSGRGEYFGGRGPRGFTPGFHRLPRWGMSAVHHPIPPSLRGLRRQQDELALAVDGGESDGLSRKKGQQLCVRDLVEDDAS